MQSAEADNAKERNILSLGSLQTVTFSVTFTERAFVKIFSMNEILVGKERYLSNFVLVKTEKYSSLISSDTSSVPASLALKEPNPVKNSG